jgi:uncharacterized protein (TIGR03083 family)
MVTGTERSREVDAFLDALHYTAPQVVSACEGWTAHEVTAHLTGIVVEISRHLSPYLAGEPVPETCSFEEREAPFQAMGDAELSRVLEAEEEHTRSLMDQVLADEADAVIPWTGRQMVVAKFWPHLRNEFAIHRWDVVGDDDTSMELLSQPDLTEHAVGILGEILTRRGHQNDPEPDQDFHVRLRSGTTADVCLVVSGGRARLEFAEAQNDEPHVELDAAARVLMIWGRRPAQRGRVRSRVGRSTLLRLQALLSGY